MHGLQAERGRLFLSSLASVGCFHLEIEFAENNVHHVSANPDFFAVLAQMNAARALEHCALSRDIGRLGESRAEEPLRNAGGASARDRIFVAPAADESARLEGPIAVTVRRTS